MPKIVLTHKAESDLDGIYEHYAPLIGSKKAEDAVFEVLEAIARLEMFPHMGKASDIPDCRELIFSRLPYRAIYTLKGQSLLIYRLLHQHAERSENGCVPSDDQLRPSLN